MGNIRTVVLFMVLLVATGASAQWKRLVWSDEFNYTGLPDSTKWSYDVGSHGWGNNELQHYTAGRLENARVENGNLVIATGHFNAMARKTNKRFSTIWAMTYEFNEQEQVVHFRDCFDTLTCARALREK